MQEHTSSMLGMQMTAKGASTQRVQISTAILLGTGYMTAR